MPQFMFMIRPLCIVLVLFFSLLAHAATMPAAASPAEIISEKVTEPYAFYGLASYYNNVNYYVVDTDSLHRISEEVVTLSQDQWLAAVGRLNVLLIQAKGLSARLDENTLVIGNSEVLNESSAVVKTVSKPELASIAPELDQIRYAHLWQPLAWLSKLVERSLTSIQANIVSNWGLAVVVFSVLLKIILLPVGVMTVRFQRKVSQVQALLAPQLVEIKANYDGEEAHNRLMSAHKKLGVSPFYPLKPMLATLIQIPILIAVFNALGEMPQFGGQAFLWIENLAYPDVIGALPFSVPMFGNTVSALPFVMTAVTLFATVVFQNRHAPEKEVKRQKRNLYVMATVFFVLFYTFPAVMVLYWTLANLLHIVQQQFIKI
jgi:YidC/Oxa1 family membrane protein insertase